MQIYPSKAEMRQAIIDGKVNQPVPRWLYTLLQTLPADSTHGVYILIDDCVNRDFDCIHKGLQTLDSYKFIK